jgi:hypothetical protein
VEVGRGTVPEDEIVVRSEIIKFQQLLNMPEKAKRWLHPENGFSVLRMVNISKDWVIPLGLAAGAGRVLHPDSGMEYCIKNLLDISQKFY